MKKKTAINYSTNDQLTGLSQSSTVTNFYHYWEENQTIKPHDNNQTNVYPTSIYDKPIETHVTVNKSKLKNYSDTFYMSGDTEFEFEFFNPNQVTYGIKIKINGNLISNNMLVLYPGKRLSLDRYLDNNNKFKFTTYTVDNTEESKNAISKNGNIEFEFYREYIKPKQSIFVPKNINHIYFNNSLTSGNDLQMITSNYSANLNIETGRIDNGSQSNTSFSNVNVQFENLPMFMKSFKLLPVSLKPIEPKDLIVKCSSCNKKAKKDHKFCSSCGTKL